ncbi:hypothetical protein FAZ95_14025 [Trinickia violacea]|uniref:Uncharacterized protein n=1 Tax=Trinickia violacea TaxID=2571746 RepID=A0A4V1EHG6_9BURK|nr:hypothetical protein [Trinickia violacea]QCP50200.1 hypothetical protein FAZ95_14025 [Trinickia violacea]
MIDRINELQGASQYFVDPSTISSMTREWRLLKREIDALFAVDACSAWELAGMWFALAGDRDGMERAFSKSLALGVSVSNHLNLMVNRLNLGMFSAAQEVYREVGAPEAGVFTTMVQDGITAGAIFTVARFAERAQEMGIEWNDGDWGSELTKAAAVLRKSGISEEQIARHLDIAGDVLIRHGVRPRVVPAITSAPGFFEGVTYLLTVPVTPNEAFDMNIELAMAEDAAGIAKDVAFDVVFEAAEA